MKQTYCQQKNLQVLQSHSLQKQSLSLSNTPSDIEYRYRIHVSSSPDWYMYIAPEVQAHNYA